MVEDVHSEEVGRYGLQGSTFFQFSYVSEAKLETVRKA
jgi:hypothetical protein